MVSMTTQKLLQVAAKFQAKLTKQSQDQKQAVNQLVVEARNFVTQAYTIAKTSGGLTGSALGETWGALQGITNGFNNFMQAFGQGVTVDAVDKAVRGVNWMKSSAQGDAGTLWMGGISDKAVLAKMVGACDAALGKLNQAKQLLTQAL